MANTKQAAREANVEAIVGFYQSGIKQRSKRLGIELEHILLHTDGTPVSYSEPHGVEWLLGQLKANYPVESRDPEGDLLGVSRPGEAVTIEPAAQVELSAGPFSSLSDADVCFNAFERRLESVLEPVGINVAPFGYNPVARAADLELIPKRRYDLMNSYLGAISPYGVCMMRGSASTQVSIDYTSDADCLRKLRIAFALVPIISLICDNSPVFEGAARTHNLVRTKIWQHCDPARCGIVPGVMSPSFTLEDYARYVLDTPAILVPDEHDQWQPSSHTFGEIYAETPMTRKDVEHALSMFFTDVRLKTYIEIRPADAMPIPYVIAYAAMIKGLFYSDESLDALDALFDGVTDTDITSAKESLMSAGYEGSVYGKPAGELAATIMSIARGGLQPLEKLYIDPLANLVDKRVTLATLSERDFARR